MLEFFYDIASPYSHIAAHRIGPRAAELGVEVQWRPFLLGGVFKAVGNRPPAGLKEKAAFMLQDLHRWAARSDLGFQFSSSFPHNSIVAQRVLTAAEPEELQPISLALFKAAWIDNQNIGDPAVVAAVLGERAEALLTKAQEQPVKDRLRAVTEEAVRRGAFGAPTFLVADELFWGNDRLEMALEEAAG